MRASSRCDRRRRPRPLWHARPPVRCASSPPRADRCGAPPGPPAHLRAPAPRRSARRAGYERDPTFEIEELCRGHSSLPRRDALRARRRPPSTSLPARRILHRTPDGTMQVSMAQHDHHEHGSELSGTQLRVRALETVLTEKGYIDPAALDLIIEAYETKVGPHTGARI